MKKTIKTMEPVLGQPVYRVAIHSVDQPLKGFQQSEKEVDLIHIEGCGYGYELDGLYHFGDVSAPSLQHIRDHYESRKTRFFLRYYDEDLEITVK